MSPDAPLVAFSTSNYDAMIKFLRDFGFTVIEKRHGDQLIPFFEHGRGARANRAGFEFQLEESDSPNAKACFNLYLVDATSEEIARVKSLGYDCHLQSSLCGDFHTFRSPDGGLVVI